MNLLIHSSLWLWAVLFDAHCMTAVALHAGFDSLVLYNGTNKTNTTLETNTFFPNNSITTNTSITANTSITTNTSTITNTSTTASTFIATSTSETTNDTAPIIDTLPHIAPAENVCLSEAFEFNIPNVLDSNVLSNYTDWSRSELASYLKPAGLYENEIEAIGAVMFGVSNFTCSFGTGECSAIPSCSDLKNWQDGVVPTADQIDDLRKRYFLSKILSLHMKYYHAQYSALKDAKYYDVGKWPATSFWEEFTKLPWINQDKSQSYPDAIQTCEIQKAITLAMIDQIIGLASLVCPAVTCPALSSMMTHAFAIATTWISDDSPSEQVPLDVGQTRFELLGAQLDTDRCSGSMGTFKDGKWLAPSELTEAVRNMFEEMRTWLSHRVEQRLQSSSFVEGDGRSTLSDELSNFLWAVAEIAGNDLHDNIRRNIAPKIAGNIISQVMRSQQCYVICQTPPSTPGGAQFDPDVTTNGSLLDLSTFDTNLIQANQCQLACLSQDAHYQPDLSRGLEQLKIFPQPLDSTKLLDEAVLSHLVGQRKQFSEVERSYPTFSLPVCMSDSVGIMNVTGTPKAEFEKRGTLREDWHVPTFFPFHCGDWRANETQRFIGEIEQKQHYESIGFKKQDHYQRMMVNLAFWLDGSRPLTSFLTFCEAGRHWPRSGKWYKLYTDGDDGQVGEGAEEVCAQLKEDIKDMDEIEATMWFCNGPTVRKVIRNENTVEHYCNHIEQCFFGCPTYYYDSMQKRPWFWQDKGRNNNVQRFPSEWKDYVPKIEAWEEDGKSPYPYRWERDPALIPSTNPTIPLHAT